MLDDTEIISIVLVIWICYIRQ